MIAFPLFLQQHHQQQRNINTGNSFGISSTNNNNNPYRVLGIPLNSTLETAHKAFIKLALQHHPDTSSEKNNNQFIDDDDDDESTISTTQNFVQIRQAFERIRNDSAKRYNKYNNNRDDQYVDPIIISWTEDDFLNWFYEQTGLRLTSDQRRELVQLYRSRIPGGRYDGPSWELARRLVAEQDAFLLRQQQQQQRGHHSSSSSSSFSTSSSSAANGERKTKNNTNSNPIRRKRKR